MKMPHTYRKIHVCTIAANIYTQRELCAHLTWTSPPHKDPSPDVPSHATAQEEMENKLRSTGFWLLANDGIRTLVFVFLVVEARRS